MNDTEKCFQPAAPEFTDNPVESSPEEMKATSLANYNEYVEKVGFNDLFIEQAIKEHLPRSYDGNTYPHAKRELEMGGWLKKGEDTMYDGMIGEAVLELISVFAGQGHSGMTAPITANLFNKLAKHEPLGPLTGEEDEWGTVADDINQNKREGTVFRNGKDGKAYYLDAIVWQCIDEGYEYDSFTGSLNGITSRQYIKEFPFTPKTFRIGLHRIEHGSVIPSDDIDYFENRTRPKDSPDAPFESTYWSYELADPSQLDEVWEYYDKYGVEDK